MKYYISFFVLVLLLSNNVAPVYAQTTTPDGAVDLGPITAPAATATEADSATPSAAQIGTPQADSPLKCFDYYKFGSVQADLQPQVAQTIPGAKITFSGKVVNENNYPLLDGTLYVKIFKSDEAVFAAGDGNPVVDQFVIQDGITLKENGSVPVSFDWAVPLNLEGGDYYAAYFFTTSHRYNLMGLPFSDDVVGNQAYFKVTNNSNDTVTTLSKTDTSINGVNHNFIAFPPHFAAGETITIKTTLTNSSQKSKTLPLQWNQYSWDSINKDNLRYTKTEAVTLKPGETKTVSYQVQPQRESVIYVIGVTQDEEVKSFINVRLVRDGSEETRINFPGLSAFPLQKDQAATLFACAHAVNTPLVPGNTLTLTLKDRVGKVLHEYRYEGDLSASMGGYGETFTPAGNVDYATLTATLERNGVIVEQVTETYDCAAIDNTTCLPELSKTSIIDWLKHHGMNILLVLLILLAAAIVYFYRRHKGPHIVANNMTSTTMLLLLMVGAFAFTPGLAEAKTTQVGGFVSEDTFKIYDYVNFSFAADYTVTYFADVLNADTGASINDGDTIPQGTKVKFVPKPRVRTGNTTSDVHWNILGDVVGTPYGYWGYPSDYCSANDLYGEGNGANDGLVRVYTPFMVGAPTENITNSGVTLNDLGGGVYQTASVGTLQVIFEFPSAPASFSYHFKNNNNNRGACSAAGYAETQVPKGTITFNITVAEGSNRPPYPPVIAGPTSGQVSMPYQFSFTGSDDDGDQVKYGIDWNNDGTEDAWAPGSGFVNSGTAANSSYTWGDTDTYTFQAFTEDSKGARSGWTQYQITIGAGAGGGGSPCEVEQTQINDVEFFVGGGPAPECDGRNYVSPLDGGTGLYFQYRNCTEALSDGSISSIGSCFGKVKMMGKPTNRCVVYAYECVGTPQPPVVTADLKINGSDGPVDVPKNTVVTLTWGSTNAASCSKWGGSWGSGETVGSSGSDTTTVTSSGTYMVNCGGVLDSVDVRVVNQPPNAPAITHPTGTADYNTNTTFTITGTDPDGDNVYYEVDWDNDGSEDARTLQVPSGNSEQATKAFLKSGDNWIQARTVDTSGLKSGWTQYKIFIGAPPKPTASLEAAISGGGFSSNDQTINPGDTVTLKWDSTDADSCTASQGATAGFDTGGQKSGADGVTPPAPNTQTTFTVTCIGLGGSGSKSLTITTRQLPNFSQPNIDYQLSTTFNLNTGAYDFVDVSFNTTNNGGSDTRTNANYQLQFDRGRDGYEFTKSDSMGLLTVNQPFSKTERVTGNIPFGNARVRVMADNTDQVLETNERDNERIVDLALPPPDPGLDITADKMQLREGETTTLRWKTLATYALNCKVFGPNLNKNPSGRTGSQVTAPITAKSLYTFECTEPITGKVFSDSVTIETVGKIEEI